MFWEKEMLGTGLNFLIRPKKMTKFQVTFDKIELSQKFYITICLCKIYVNGNKKL